MENFNTTYIVKDMLISLKNDTFTVGIAYQDGFITNEEVTFTLNQINAKIEDKGLKFVSVNNSIVLLDESNNTAQYNCVTLFLKKNGFYSLVGKYNDILIEMDVEEYQAHAWDRLLNISLYDMEFLNMTPSKELYTLSAECQGRYQPTDIYTSLSSAQLALNEIDDDDLEICYYNGYGVDATPIRWNK